MSSAMASLTPRWVTEKETGITDIAPALTGIYPHLTAIDTAVEDIGTVGHYTPLSGKTLPADAAAAETASHTADPITDWDTGSYVETMDGVGMHFNTSAWADGPAP